MSAASILQHGIQSKKGGLWCPEPSKTFQCEDTQCMKGWDDLCIFTATWDILVWLCFWRSVLQESTAPRQMPRKHSLFSVSQLEKKFDSAENLRCSSPGDAYVSFRCFEWLMKQGIYDALTLKFSLAFGIFHFCLGFTMLKGNWLIQCDVRLL